MNINEVARLAGVSRATVSRYLNDGYVSAEKREAIARVIAETGYIPSAQAQTLRTGRTNFVAVIIPKLSSESIARMVEGISQGLPTTTKILLANTANDEDAEVSYLRSLGSHLVDGVILVATVLTPRHARAVRDLDVPLVVLGQHADWAPCVHFDDYAAMHALCTRVLATSKHPAFIGVTERDLAAGDARRRAFRDACAEAGVEDAFEAVSPFTAEGGRACATQVLADRPQTDALLCATDTIASGALRAARAIGREVPGELQVTGIGDGSICEMMLPALSTARYRYEAAGRSAALQLLDLMEGKKPEQTEITEGFRLVMRESTLN